MKIIFIILIIIKFLQDQELEDSAISSQDVEKYRNFVDDLSRVIHTILLLAARLAKAENAKGNWTNQGEDEVLERRVQTLRKQHEEATELKDSIDKRGKKV